MEAPEKQTHQTFVQRFFFFLRSSRALQFEEFAAVRIFGYLREKNTFFKKGITTLFGGEPIFVFSPNYYRQFWGGPQNGERAIQS